MKNISGNVSGWTGVGGGNRPAEESKPGIVVERKTVDTKRLASIIAKANELKTEIEAIQAETSRKQFYDSITHIDLTINGLEEVDQ